MAKTSYSLNFKWLAVIKNNLICVALVNLHATEWLQCTTGKRGHWVQAKQVPYFSPCLQTLLVMFQEGEKHHLSYNHSCILNEQILFDSLTQHKIDILVLSLTCTFSQISALNWNPQISF